MRGVGCVWWWEEQSKRKNIRTKRYLVYRNFPKFSDRQVWANSADPDQTAPRGAV